MTKSLYPQPVIVASFAGGEHVRMTFWQPSPRAGAMPQWRYDAAVGMAQAVIGNERFRAAFPGRCFKHNAPIGIPAEDLLSAHIEWNGEIVRQEAPASAKVVSLPSAARILAAVKSLSWADIEALQSAIDERIAA